MRLFGLGRKKANISQEISTEAQFRPTAPQGWMTSWFQDYYMRKVSGDFYEILREGIPIIDAGIRRLISLNGTIKIIGDKGPLVRELEDFVLSVPVNDKQKGIHAFLENVSNETFEQGFSLAEFVATKDLRDIEGLRVADSKHIIFRKNKEGKAEEWYRYPGGVAVNTYAKPESLVQQILTATYNQAVWVNGMYEERLNPANKLYFSINNENSNPYGVSVMRSMEFVSKILMTMQNSLQHVWQRFGDPSFFILYKATKKDLQGDELEARRQQIQTKFDSAIRAKREGKSADFVAAVNMDADMVVEVIGHDNKVLNLQVPARHVLEQIVSKLNLPAWMLGIYWSTTERMATLEVESSLQDAKIRQLAMLPEFIRLFSVYLKLRGHTWKQITTDVNKPGDWGIVFETPNLRDLVSQAQARFLNAQADMMQNGSQETPRDPKREASVEIGGMKFPVRLNGTAGQKCGCDHQNKELSRPDPWPELDDVENGYEEKLKSDWLALEKKVFDILKLAQFEDIPEPMEQDIFSRSAIEGGTKQDPPGSLPSLDSFTFSDEQRAEITGALKEYLGTYDWRKKDSPVRWYYGQSYSLGLIQAAKMVGRERPILDIIKNQEVFEKLAKEGFKLVKDNATKAIVEKIVPEMQAHVLAGSNPVQVARRLKKLFGDKNSDWERLARSELSMAAEQAKLDEWEAWETKTVDFAPAPDACPICMALAGEYEIDKAPLPVRDTHPRCRCSLRPGVSEG